MLALSASFEYICYGSTVTWDILILSACGDIIHVRIWRLQTSDSDVWRLSPHVISFPIIPRHTRPISRTTRTIIHVDLKYVVIYSYSIKHNLQTFPHKSYHITSTNFFLAHDMFCAFFPNAPGPHRLLPADHASPLCWSSPMTQLYHSHAGWRLLPI